MVFLIGQPGAGKSKVTEMVARVLDRRGGFVDVDSDLYKPYHPEYDALMAQDDTLMAAYTRADGRAWMAQAEAHVRENRLNAVVQETSQDGAAVERKMAAYRAAGYRIEALVMGVPEAMSNQGIVNRYYEQVQDRGQGRLTAQANADESYAGILDLADRIDRGQLAHQASVFRRGEGKPRYSNSLDASGRWHAPPTLRKAIETERSRPWTDAESAGFVAAQQRLRLGMATMGTEWSERLNRIDALAKPLITPAGADQLVAARRSAAAKRSSTSGRPATKQGKGGPTTGSPAAGPNQAPERRHGPDDSQGRGRSK